MVRALFQATITVANAIIHFTGVFNNQIFFLVKWVPDRGPEQRESEKTVLNLQIIIILISYIIIYFYLIIN